MFGGSGSTFRNIVVLILGIAVLALVLKSKNTVPLINASSKAFTGALSQAQRG
jgi:hypothetical protein